MVKKKSRYVIVSGGFFLVSAKKALNGDGLEGGAYTRDLSKAKSYAIRKDAVKVASTLYRAVPYRVGDRDVLTIEGLKVGDTLVNRYVGECRVERIMPSRVDQPLTWVDVSYDAYVFSKEANERMRRADPVGVGDDGIPYFTTPKSRTS